MPFNDAINSICDIFSNTIQENKKRNSSKD